MCGRFTLTASREALHNLFPLFDLPDLEPRYNVAPTQGVLAVRQQAGTNQPEATTLHWGLVPSWADDAKIGNRLINARAETAPDKPAFRSAFRQRRCLIVADGFFEWQKVDRRKQPYLFRLREGGPFAFAGLWERWDRGEQPVESCTVLTTTANALVKPVHERMPVILSPDDFARWLDPRVQKDPELVELLRPFPADAMSATPVGLRVNNARYDDPGCIAPLSV
jgi:putative SOS response-associated peptidase YedK